MSTILTREEKIASIENAQIVISAEFIKIGSLIVDTINVRDLVESDERLLEDLTIYFGVLSGVLNEISMSGFLLGLASNIVRAQKDSVDSVPDLF